MNKLMIIAGLGVLGLGYGCSNSTKKKPVKTAAQPTAPQMIDGVPVVEAQPKREIKFDENGNAYEVLQEHERLCQNCDR